MSTITVIFPIEVPDGKYCWGKTTDDIREICEHFNNEGGYDSCDLGFPEVKHTTHGVLKDPKCADATELLNMKNCFSRVSTLTKDDIRRAVENHRSTTASRQRDQS